MPLRLLLAALAFILAAPAVADSWAAPQVAEVFSANHDHFVRITPGNSMGDVMGFAGSPKGPYAQAEYYARQPDRSYKLTARATLLNPVAPVRFFVSDSGRLATIDNWHNMGFGKVVAIYDPSGKVVKSYELAELFTAADLKAIPQSVSSLHWRGQATYVREDQRTLYVHAANEGGFLFGLESGRFTYCENHAGKQRCRNSSAADAWHSGKDMIDQ
ncbi:MAG: hypothetical protein ABIO47_08195 [Sphingomicrobium sp.]